MIVVDVETTGVVPGKSGIVSVGAIEFEHPHNQFYIECRVGPKTLVDPYALKVNGFNEEQIRDPAKPSQTQAMRQFADWTKPIADKTLAGHNTAFDIRMLRAAFQVARLELTLFYSAIDMHNLVYAQMKRTDYPIPINRFGAFSAKADHVYPYVGLPSEPQPHNGLTGAKMEAEAMCRLLHGRSLLPEFTEYPLPGYLITRNDNDRVPNKPPIRPGSKPAH